MITIKTLNIFSENMTIFFCSFLNGHFDNRFFILKMSQLYPLLTLYSAKNVSFFGKISFVFVITLIYLCMLIPTHRTLGETEHLKTQVTITISCFQISLCQQLGGKKTSKQQKQQFLSIQDSLG